MEEMKTSTNPFKIPTSANRTSTFHSHGSNNTRCARHSIACSVYPSPFLPNAARKTEPPVHSASTPHPEVDERPGVESRYRSARRDHASGSWWNVSRYAMRSGMAFATAACVGVGLAVVVVVVVDGDGDGEGDDDVDVFGAGYSASVINL